MGKDPPKYMGILDHMGKESSFLPRSAPFPSFPPPPKMQRYPSPQILSHLYVWKDSFPLQNAKPHKSSTVHFLFYIFIFHFILIYLHHCFEFPFFPFKTSPSRRTSPKDPDMSRVAARRARGGFLWSSESTSRWTIQNLKFFPKVEKLFPSVWGE